MTAEGGATRRDAWVTVAVGLLLIAGLARAVAMRSAFVAAHPMNAVFLLGGLAGGIATFLPNRAGIRLGRTVVAFLGYGGLACLLGFNLQSAVNLGLERLLAPPPFGLGAFALLGLGAAVCQTLGKCAGVALLLRQRRPAGVRAVLAIGLAVGLGFGLAEVVVITQQVIGAGKGMEAFPVLGIWERTSAVGFHIYSSGLIALGLARRSWAPVGTVVALHTLLDTVAGAVGGGALAINPVALQVAFLAMALAAWGLYLREKARYGGMMPAATGFGGEGAWR